MSGLEDAILGAVSRETLDDLHSFANLFTAHAATTNLVARSTLPVLWERHVLDSAQLVGLSPSALRWLDLGSGGGFPGIVTAILLKGREGAMVDLVESTGKKAGFLRLAVETLGLPARVWNERAEALGDRLAVPDVISARAFAPLPRLLGWAAPWLAKGAVGLFHKGRNWQAEAEESHAQWDFSMLEHASRTDSQAAILEIRDLRRRKVKRSAG